VYLKLIFSKGVKLWQRNLVFQDEPEKQGDEGLGCDFELECKWKLFV
jgi:hypothetical protein